MEPVLRISTALILLAFVFFSSSYFIRLVCLFHLGEFTLTWKFHPKQVCYSSFLLDNGKSYNLCIILSIFESMWSSNTEHFLGLLIASFGLLLRWLGMVTAGSNFTHQVAYIKTEDHVLITHGIYSYYRHPGYAGWFWWVFGLQVMSQNHICLVLYSVTIWIFFYSRIQIEEEYLKRFFGEKYTLYAEKVGSGIPGIS
jgi:protein-S-isoprenylcysteine O-methyltransferase